MELLNNIGGWVTGLGIAAVGLTALVSWGAYWLFNKYLFPQIDTPEEKEVALIILKALDDITDDIKKRFPNNKWANAADKLVDKIQNKVMSTKIKQ